MNGKPIPFQIRYRIYLQLQLSPLFLQAQEWTDGHQQIKPKSQCSHSYHIFVFVYTINYFEHLLTFLFQDNKRKNEQAL